MTVEIAKANHYAVLSLPPGVSIAKANHYTVLRPNPGVILTDYANPQGSGERRFDVDLYYNITWQGSIPEEIIDGTQNNELYWTSGQSGRFLVFDFRRPRVIEETRWYQSSSTTHGTWRWEGSTDFVTWEPISVNFTLGGTYQVRSFNIDQKAFRYYRLAQQSGTTSSSPYLREIEFKIDAVEADPNLPSYANPQGSGDRRGTIAVSTNAVLSGSGDNNLQEILDGSYANALRYFAQDQSGRHITFDFGNPVVVDGARWSQSTSASHGVWRWEGSNDDATWAVLSENITFNGSERFYGLNRGKAAYRYYRLAQQSGSTSVNPSLREMEFRVGGAGGVEPEPEPEPTGRRRMFVNS